MKNVYEFEADGIGGEKVPLNRYKGQALLVVNVASRCGFTPQYEGLEKLHEKYKDRGFTILGFPCNQFGNQEPGTSSEIAQFCQVQFGVKFPLFAKIEVNGAHAHPLYQFLARAKRGFLGTKRIKWNFTKFLVDRDGNPVKRFGPSTKPEALDSEIEKVLAK